ncbi:MAG: FAD-dependent oxidoreductase, partial [Deltaproteobacteria bacterium]
MAAAGRRLPAPPGAAVRGGPSRRRVLQGAAAAALLPRPARAGRRHVVVVGGGPAGLSAAVELVEAGMAVTLCEASDRLGGKARGWTLQEGGRRLGAVLEMEHGAHGIGTADRALLSLLSRYGLDGALGAPVIATPQPQPPGWRRTLRAAARGEGGRAEASWIASARYLAGDGAPVVDRAAATWLSTGARYLAGTADEWLWDPLGDLVRGFGGVVRLATRVQALRVDNGAVVGVRLGLPAARIRVDGDGLSRVTGEE